MHYVPTRTLPIAPPGIRVLILGIAILHYAVANAGLLRDTHVVAITGTPSPDDTGILFSPLRPVMQRSTQPVFVSDIRDEGFHQGWRIFRADWRGQLHIMARSGDPLPDANGTFHPFNDPDIQVNDTGAIAWKSSIDDSLGGALDDQAIFYTEGPDEGIVIIARKNQDAPSGIGKFTVLPGLVTLNNAGQVGFRAAVVNNVAGMFRANTATADMTVIAVEGDAVPEGTGTFTDFNSQVRPSLNESGQIAFLANVNIDATNLTGIFVGDGTTTTEMVRKNESTPSGDGVFGLQPIIYHPLNESGHLAFFSNLTGTAGGTVDNEGIYISTGEVITEVARKSDFTPGDNGRYLNFDRRIEFNDLGQVLFGSTITGAGDGATEGIFLGTASGVKTVARVNQAAPGGGHFEDFSRGISLNNRGEALFFATIDLDNGGVPNDTHGLFLWDGKTITAVARAGDVIAGTGVIDQIVFDDDTFSTTPESSPLSDGGEVSYRFFSGGDIGIALWMPPLFADSFEGDAGAPP